MEKFEMSAPEQNPEQAEPKGEKEEDILSGFKVEEVELRGEKYYRLNKHFTLPSGKGEKLFRKSLCPKGLEEHIRELMEKDLKDMADLEKDKAQKREEENKKMEAEKNAKEEEIKLRKKMAGAFINLPDGKEYGCKGSELIPFTAKEVGSEHDVVSLVKKENGRVIFICSSGGSIFGFSKGGYHSEEEIDATDFLKKELEK